MVLMKATTIRCKCQFHCQEVRLCNYFKVKGALRHPLRGYQLGIVDLQPYLQWSQRGYHVPKMMVQEPEMLCVVSDDSTSNVVSLVQLCFDQILKEWTLQHVQRFSVDQHIQYEDWTLVSMVDETLFVWSIGCMQESPQRIIFCFDRASGGLNSNSSMHCSNELFISFLPK